MRDPFTVISADSHLEVSANIWRDRVPEKYRGRAPRVIRLPDGSDAWQGENSPLHLVSGASSLVAGVPWQKWQAEGRSYEGAPGAGPPEQRLREQDMDGIDAEVLFPTVGGRITWNYIADDDAYHAVVFAYNEWLAEDYCSAAPARLIGVGVIPERGVSGAIAELEHCARLGLKGVNIGMFPNGKAFPMPEDDRFWTAALDMQMPVTVHDEIAGRGPGPELASRISTYGVKGALAVCRFVIYGVFERFPQLHVYVAENQIGWIPNFLEQMDILWARHRYYLERAQGLAPLPRPPSDYVRSNILWGFMDNPIGVQLRHLVGVDKVMWSNDMPHAPTDWPHSVEVIERNFRDVPEDERYAMLAGNAISFFHLDPTFESSEERERRVADRRAGKAPELVVT